MRERFSNMCVCILCVQERGRERVSVYVCVCVCYSHLQNYYIRILWMVPVYVFLMCS